MVAGMKQDIKTTLTRCITDNQAQFYRLAYSYVHQREAALDVVQNAVVRALEKYDTIRDPRAVKTWFYRIVVNESLRYLDKYGRELPCEPEDFRDIPAQESEDTDYELYRRIDQLPADIKTIIILRFYEQLSLKEIAQVTDLRLSTVKYRLYAGLSKLKTAIEEEAI